MDLPWSTADTPEEDVGHALEGTAFQGVSVFVIPRSILGAPPRVSRPQSSDRNVSGEMSGDMSGDMDVSFSSRAWRYKG